MNLRKIEKSELHALLELYQHLHERDVPLPESQIVDDVWSSIQRSPDINYFGAFVSEALVSSCTLSIIPNLTRGCKPYGVIENVVTAPQFRKQGIGTAVLQHALKHAWRCECYKVMLLTGRKEERMYQFYESAGFDRHAKQAFLARPPLGKAHNKREKIL